MFHFKTYPFHCITLIRPQRNQFGNKAKNHARIEAVPERFRILGILGFLRIFGILGNLGGFGFWILDFGFWILDWGFGFWILDCGFWIVDFGLGSGYDLS